MGRTLLDYVLESCRIGNAPPELWVLTRNPAAIYRGLSPLPILPFLHLRGADLQDATIDRSLKTLPDTFTDVIHAAADTHASGSRLQWLDQIVGGTS